MFWQRMHLSSSRPFPPVPVTGAELRPRLWRSLGLLRVSSVFCEGLRLQRFLCQAFLFISPPILAVLWLSIQSSVLSSLFLFLSFSFSSSVVFVLLYFSIFFLHFFEYFVIFFIVFSCFLNLFFMFLFHCFRFFYHLIFVFKICFSFRSFICFLYFCLLSSFSSCYRRFHCFYLIFISHSSHDLFVLLPQMFLLHIPVFVLFSSSYQLPDNGPLRE